MTIKIEIEERKQGYIVADVDCATIEECKEFTEKIIEDNKDNIRWASIDNLVLDVSEV